jgi:hypothetical protein
MPFAFLAASSFSGAVLFIGFVVILSACVAVYVLAPRPLERLAQYRLPKVEKIQFETLLYASIGDTPTHHQWFRGTLAFAVDSDWVYLRHSRFLRSPIIWRIPREKIQLHDHKDWDVLIYSTDRPLNAFFGPNFVAAFRGKRRSR